MNESLSEQQMVPIGTQFSEYQLLLKYLHEILRYKYRVIIAAILGAGCVFAGSLLVEERYAAQATVAMNVNEANGGVKPSEYRGSNTIGVLEYSFIIEGTQSNERERHLARMESFGFISDFIQEQNLLPTLYSHLWDVEQQQWSEEQTPDMREAVKTFKSKVLYIFSDPKTELLRVRMTLNNPVQAAYLVNEFVAAYNLYIRELAMQQLETRRVYLERRLVEIRNKEMHRSIYRLLEAQLAYESIIHARENHPLEMIQPATPPLFESYPDRKQWALLALVAFMFLGFAMVIVISVSKRLRDDLSAYARQQSILDVEPKKHSAVITRNK